MARIKGAVATRKRRKKIMKMAKGFWGAKSKQFRTANAAVMRSMANSYIGRKQMTRISAAAKRCGMNYSTFMHGLKLAQIDLNRKMLAEIAVCDMDGFRALADKAKAALPQ